MPLTECNGMDLWAMILYCVVIFFSIIEGIIRIQLSINHTAFMPDYCREEHEITSDFGKVR